EAGRVEAALGPGAWRVDVGGLVVVATGAGAWRPGDAVAVVVRPERIRLDAHAGAASGGNEVAGSVEECIFRGASRRYRLRLPNGRVWSVDEPASGARSLYPVGTPVRLSWRVEDCLAVPG